MVALAPFPVLLRGSDAPGVSKVVVIGTDTESLNDDAKVYDLLGLLRGTVKRNAANGATGATTFVKDVELYGTTLNSHQSLASLVLEHSSVIPRLVASTVSRKRYGNAELSVKTLTGETLYLPYAPSSSVDNVKQWIQDLQDTRRTSNDFFSVDGNSKTVAH